VFVALGGRS